MVGFLNDYFYPIKEGNLTMSFNDLSKSQSPEKKAADSDAKKDASKDQETKAAPDAAKK